MKRKYSILSLALVLALLLGLAPAAHAALRPELVCTPGRGTGEVQLALEGLDGSGIYGAQVALTVSGEYPGCVFTPYDAGAYSPGCQTAVSGGRTEVTIYLSGQTPLNNRGLLELGTLSMGSGGGTDTLPRTARMTLLNRGLEPLTGAMSGDVPVAVGSRYPDGGGSGGSGWPGGGTGGGTGGGSQTEKPAEKPPEQPSAPDPGNVVLPFTDVGSQDWFYEAVRFVYARGMMSGTAEDRFSPQQTTTRAMLVTILHRLEGSPDAGAGTAFHDVAPEAYYARSVAWASANGIVNGFGDGSFRPGDPITREQMAAIFMRYARYRGVDVSAQASLDGFPDQGKVSSYAREAMAWSVSTGLISGMDGLLVPGGSATRAQAATILMRLCVNVLEAA